MSFGGQVGGSKSTSTTTTPWTGLTSILAPTLVSGLTNVASGGSTAAGAQAITNQAKQMEVTGAQGIKSAFAGSGMAQSTDLIRGLSQYSQQSNINLQSTLAQFYQTGIQDQLAALAEIISLGSGSSSTSASQLGWGLAAKIG